MALAVIHGLLPNQKLKSILEGCANLNHLRGSSQDSRNLFARAFFLPQCVYIRFKYSRFRKFLQLTNDKLVQAELALRFWKENNLHVWAPIPLFVDRANYRCLELALIPEWQPRLNYPFICPLFHPRKSLLKTPAIIHALGSNTKARFEQTKLLRSIEGGLTLCYTLRRLANKIQEPYRIVSLGAIDPLMAGKTSSTCVCTEGPLVFDPKSSKDPQTISSQLASSSVGSSSPMPHTIFLKTVFIKHVSVLDQLCNHKQATSEWSTNSSAQ